MESKTFNLNNPVQFDELIRVVGERDDKLIDLLRSDFQKSLRKHLNEAKKASSVRDLDTLLSEVLEKNRELKVLGFTKGNHLGTVNEKNQKTVSVIFDQFLNELEETIKYIEQKRTKFLLASTLPDLKDERIAEKLGQTGFFELELVKEKDRNKLLSLLLSPGIEGVEDTRAYQIGLLDYLKYLEKVDHGQRKDLHTLIADLLEIPFDSAKNHINHLGKDHARYRGKQLTQQAVNDYKGL